MEYYGVPQWCKTSSIHRRALGWPLEASKNHLYVGSPIKAMRESTRCPKGLVKALGFGV